MTKKTQFLQFAERKWIRWNTAWVCKHYWNKTSNSSSFLWSELCVLYLAVFSKANKAEERNNCRWHESKTWLEDNQCLNQDRWGVCWLLMCTQSFTDAAGTVCCTKYKKTKELFWFNYKHIQGGSAGVKTRWSKPESRDLNQKWTGFTGCDQQAPGQKEKLNLTALPTQHSSSHFLPLPSPFSLPVFQTSSFLTHLSLFSGTRDGRRGRNASKLTLKWRQLSQRSFVVVWVNLSHRHEEG